MPADRALRGVSYSRSQLSPANTAQQYTHQAMKQRIDATSNSVPNPPKMYSSHLHGSAPQHRTGSTVLRLCGSLQERIRLVRLDLVRAVLREFPFGLLGVQTDLGVDAETLQDLIPGKEVPVEIGDLLGCIALGRLGRGALLRIGHMYGEGAASS